MLSIEERIKQNQAALNKRIQSDAAYIKQLEEDRQKQAKIETGKAIQQARVEQAKRNNQAYEYARQAAREEYETNLPEYRAQERERWKASTNAWREAENARKYYDTSEAETNAREKRRRAGAMRDYAAMQLNRTAPDTSFDPDTYNTPQDPTGRWDYALSKQRYDTRNSRADALEYEAIKALESDIPKAKKVQEYEAKYQSADDPRAVAAYLDSRYKVHGNENNWRNVEAPANTTGQVDLQAASDLAKARETADPWTQTWISSNKGEKIANAIMMEYTGRRSVFVGSGDESMVRFLTDGEKTVILNMAKAQDWDAVEDYMNALRPTLDARSFDEQMAQIDRSPKAVQAVAGMLGTVASPLAMAQTTIDKLAGTYTDINSGAAGLTRIANYGREKSLENAGKVGQFLGNAAYSTLDNLILSGLGPTGMLAVMSLGAGGQEAVRTLERGGTQNQAVMMGLVTSGIEALTEKAPIDKLFEIKNATGRRGVLAFLKDVISAALPEAAEEEVSALAGTFADRIIMGDKSEYTANIRSLEAHGLSHDDAVKRTNIDLLLIDPAKQAASGAISGAALGGLAATSQRYNQAKADRAVGSEVSESRNADIVLEEGMKSKDSRVRQLARQLDAMRHENGEDYQFSKADQRTLGEIYNTLDPEARARVDREASNRRAEAEAAEQQRIDEGAAQREAELKAEQRQRTAEDINAQLDADEAELDAEYERMKQESGEAIDMDNPDTIEDDTAEEEPQTRQTEAEEMDRLAQAADESARTGDTSVIDRARQETQRTERTEQTRQTAATQQTERTEQTLQPVQQTAQETQRTAAQPITPEQAGQQTANNARKAGLSSEDTLVMSNVARDLGVGLEFRKMKNAKINGFYNRETGYVVLNQDLSSAEMAWSTFAHEITHRSESAGSYAQLAGLAKSFFTDGADKGTADTVWRSYINDIRRQYMDEGFATTKQGAEFEAVANTIEAMLGNRDSMLKVAKYSREDAQALLESINNVLDKVTENDTAVTPEAARLVKAQKTLAAALSEVREQRSENAKQTQNDSQTDSIPSEGVPAAVSDDGEVLTSEMPGGTITKQYSLSSWTEEERRIVREELLKKGFDEKSVDKWIKDVNSIASLIAADKARLDYQADPNQVMLKLNAEYVVTLDASTLCAKRLLYQGTFNLVQKNLPNTPLMPEDLIALVNMMREEGYETPCGICYVESRRRQLGKFAQEWLNSYNGEYKPTLAEVTTSDGLANLRKTHFQTYNDFIKAMNKKGTMNPKVVQLRTDYRGDIRKMTKGNIQKVKDIGGLRVQSFSDFEIPHLIDMMQAVLDMASRELTSQAYTKVPAFPAVFGGTGIKINLSLIGKGTGLDANGNLIFDDIEGMPFDEAMRLRDMYSENVGTILVGINDEHIIAAMADDRIDFIIPFHKSGWSAKELEGMPVLNSYDDYTNSQNEKKITGTNANGTYKTEALEASKRVNFQPVGKNGYWDFNKSGEENAREYLRMCAEDGRIPKFSQFLTDNGDGTFSLPDGDDARSKAIRKGYWKTLIDFKMYDNNGKGAPQQAVKPNFNMEEANRVINNYSLDRKMPSGNVVSRESNNDLPVARDIADKYVAQYKKDHGMAADTTATQSKQYKVGYDESASTGESNAQASISGMDFEQMRKNAIEKYGRMRSGEQLVDEKGKPVTRKISMPKAYSDETKTPRFLRTAAEAKTSVGLLNDIQTRAALEQYVPKSNKETVAAAQTKRSTFGDFKEAYGYWQGLIEKGRFSGKRLAEDIAFGEQLYLEAIRENNGEAAVNILSDLAVIGTQAGQAVQAFAILKKLSPEGQLMNYKRVAQIYAQRVNKNGGKVTADVQTANDAVTTSEELLKKLDELEKLKKVEANGGELVEKEARRIAELEKEIDELKKKLKPMLDKLANLKAERHEDAMEAGKLKRQEKTLPRQIESTQKEIDEIRKVIDELNEKLEPKRIELQNKLAEETLTKEQRDKLKAELSDINEKIRNARARINRARARILHTMAEMTTRGNRLSDMQQYIKALRTSEEIINIYLRYVQNKGGGVVIPTDLQWDFINAKTDEERNAIRKKMDIAIADQLPGTWAEKIRGWRYISMLFNPTTHERNVFGNITQYTLKGMRDTLATGMERIFLKPGEERTKAIASRISKADKAYYDAANADYKIIEDDLQAGGRESETSGIDKARKIYKSKVLEAMRRFSGELLEREDKIFLQANYTQSYAEYLKANKIDPSSMTEEQKVRVRQIAFQQALEATYRDASVLANWLSNLEKQGAGWEFALGGIMPFKKTPINVLKRGVEYSPAGLIKATYDMVQATRGKNTRTKSDIIGEYASGLTGTMLSAVGLLLARAGAAFATPTDDDKDRKAALDKETGMQNYAIKFSLGGKEWTYTFDWLAPASMAFFAGVRAYEAFRNKEKMSLQAMLDGLISTVNPVFELSMLDGLSDMFRSYSSSGSGTAAAVMWSILESYALQFFPTFGSKLARVIDPFQRSTYTAKDAFPTKGIQRLYRRILAKIPGATYALENVVDSHGNLKENIGGNILGRIAYNFASPGYLKEVTHDEIDEESKRVYADTGKTEVLPKDVPTSVTMNGETYYLDAHEYRLWGERMGKEAAAGISALINTPEYQSANSVQQSKMIADIRDEAYENAKIAYYEDIGIADDYYRTGAQHPIEDLLYDDSQGYRQYKNIPAVRELYESGVLDPKTIYDAALTLSHIKKDADKLDALNNIDGLNQDEYSFLYMTKIADDDMMADIQATLDAGGDLYKAVSVAAQYYKWDDNAINEKTGEAGKWVSVDKGTKASILAGSDLTNSAKEAFYLNKIVSKNNVEREQAKIADYYSRNLTINDYLNTLGIKYDDEGTAYENAGGLYRELLASDYSDAVKEAAVCNIIKHTENSSDKAEAQIAIYKANKLTVNDYLAANAAMYGSDGKSLRTVREQAIGLRDSGMSDKAKTVAWYTTVSDAKSAEENIRTFLSGGNTVDDFLTAVAATSQDGMKQYQKAAAVMQMNLISYTSALKSVVTGSENAAKAIDGSLSLGIPDKLVARAYAEYTKINADENTYGTEKAVDFAKWLDRDSAMSSLSKDQREYMRDNFAFYIQLKASAGQYNTLMSFEGMSSKGAESISKAISDLEPLPGKKGISMPQKYTAVANANATDKEKDLAMYNLLDSDDDEADNKALKYYKDARSKGVSIAQYADFRTKNATLTADKDKNGKSISGSKRNKQLALINSYPISAAAKDALYYAAGLGASTIKKAPWH